MRQFIFLLLFTVIFLSDVKVMFGQGCSDAGVCTIHTLKDQSFNLLAENAKRNAFKSGLTYGIGERDIKYINPYVEYSNTLSDRVSIAAKIVYTFVNGELAKTNNLSDIYISSNFLVLNKELASLSTIVGLKIPLNNSNTENNDLPLPMHYQSSLGTYDIIIGANYIYSRLGISLAVQYPIVNSNENEFLTPASSDLIESNYVSTNSYERKGDLINRISYNIPTFNNKLVFRPSLLSIYHLGNDIFIDDNGDEFEIEGSQGLTINANIFLNYSITDSKMLEISLGSPFLTRDSRPDGLTRKLVAGIEYIYIF
jgi:hypothetical protein